MCIDNLRLFFTKYSFFSTVFFTLLFIGYFLFWWLFKLDELPGLHGDEAWAGIKANHFRSNGVDQLNGMNNYTGILQILLSQGAFNIYGLGVTELRLGGIILNTLGLVIITSLFIRLNRNKSAVVFLIIIAQSALYMISARVAWEVNSFTLFFSSLFMASSLKILSQSHKCIFWIPLFLIVNIFSTYNHIIFSCIPVALFCGLVLWSLFNKCCEHKLFILTLAFNLLNLIILYFTMHDWLDFVLKHINYLPIALGLILIGEYILIRKIQLLISTKIFIWTLPKRFVEGVLLFAFMSFLGFHGIALFEVLSSYKIILQFYSYECSSLIKILFVVNACIFLMYFLIYLFKDIEDKKLSLVVYTIIIYLGLFNCYTISCSFRYYLGIYAIIGIYMAFKIGGNFRKARPLVLSLMASITTLGFVFLDKFTREDDAIKSIDFNIGNGQIETTSHFLQKEPLLDYLKKNKIGNVRYLIDNPYFLEQPVLFYKLFRPWTELPSNGVFVDYDFRNYHNGYIFIPDQE